MRVDASAGVLTDASLASSVRLAWRLFRFLRADWGDLFRGIALGMASSALGLLVPILTSKLVDEMYPARDESLLLVILAGVGFVTVLSTLLGAVRSYVSQLLGGKIGSALSLFFVNHVQHLPIGFFDQHRVGEVTSRLGDVRASVAMLTRAAETLLVNSVTLLMVPIILIGLNWRLAALSLVTIPLSTWISTMAARHTAKYWSKHAQIQADLNATQVDTLSNIRTVKLACAEREFFVRLRSHHQAALVQQLAAAGLGAGLMICNALLKCLGTLASTWYGWKLVLAREISIGELFAVGAYVSYVTGPIGELSALFSELQRSSISLARMYEYLDVPTELDARAAYAASPGVSTRLRGAVELRNVAYGYSHGAHVLDDVSLSLAPGTVTAIVGPSGAGKSTLLRVLSGLDHASSGSVLFDGRPIQSLPLRDVRRQMGVVWQETGLLRGTVLENLTMGCGDRSIDEINDVVDICQLSETMEMLPDGLNSRVSEGGASLSGGQRQRLTLARALLRRAPILILDEATSNLDVHLEARVLTDAFRYAAGSTVVFATHRLATIERADNVCLLRDGRVCAWGAHGALRETKEAYRTFLAH